MNSGSSGNGNGNGNGSADLGPLAANLRALVVVERGVGAVAAPAEGKARVRARLDATLFPGPGDGGDGGGGSSGGGSGADAIARTGKLLRFAGTFMTGTVVGGLVVYTMMTSRNPSLEVVPAVSSSSASSQPALASSPASLPILQHSAADPTESAVASAQPPHSASAAAAGSGSPTLALERAILDPARTALGRGDGASALEAVRAHEKRYPTGALTEEREAIAVQALVLVDKKDEARARGKRFLTRYPGSVLVPVVNAAIDER